MLEALQAEKLINAARMARERAYVPYSSFPVGAAILTRQGRIFSGCNIENASYGLCNCAERTAIFNAVSAGELEFEAIAVIADTPGSISPCGACCQVIVEFADADTHILLSNLNGHVDEYRITDLLPKAFSAHEMNK